MKRVAVLRGGPSEEYAISMQTGANVLTALQQAGYATKDIIITKKGEWLECGKSRQPDYALDAVDIAFVALHGTYGEDGQVQKILERKSIPFTGSRSFSSALAFNKALTKQTLRPHGLTMPQHRRITRDELPNLEDITTELIVDLGSDLFVKPVATGSSFGARYIPHADALKSALEELLTQYEQVLVEEYIRGKEATVGILSDFRNQTLYALPVIEIVPPGGSPLFSYEDKYSGRTDEIVPGRFSYHEKSKLSEAAMLVHDVIGCKHYSRSDFIVRNGEVYFLEINALPGLTNESLYPKAAAAVGLSYNDLIKHLVETAHI